MASLEDGLVPQSPLLDSAAEPKTSDGFGPKSSELFGRLNADGFMEKMFPDYCLPTMEGHSGTCSGTWPSAGCLRNGLLFRRPTWELRTKDPEFSSWPTPRSEDSECCGNHPGAVETGAAGLWPTPMSVPDSEASHNQVSGQFRRQMDEAMELWNTPRTITGGAESAERKQELGRTESGGGDLQAQANLWMTPNVPNGGRSVPAETVANKGSTPEGKRTVGLESQSKFWTTPHAMQNVDHTGHVGTGNGEAMLTEQATDCISSLPAPPTETDGLKSSESDRGLRQRLARKRLNVYFVEALMGIPASWTSATEPIDSDALETWLCLCRRRLDSLCSLEGQG